MSLFYDLDLFKEKLKTCKDSGDAKVLYSVIVDHVEKVRASIDRQKAELREKEDELNEFDLEQYKQAMIERIKEF